jgi:geranylgeranyl pyrophosphate synthase
MDLEELSRVLSVNDLPELVSKVEEEFLKALPADEILRQAIIRTFNSGGKRLRPVLLLAISVIEDINKKQLLIRAGAAVELVHQASLIHDDIIDKSPLRRGKPTVAAKEGLNTALLAGDYMIASGLKLAAKVDSRAVEVLSQAVEQMCEGQLMELNLPKIKILDDKYMDVARNKSAALISASCKIGGIINGLSDSNITALGKFGENFGITFQIIDDITDNEFKTREIKAASATAMKYIHAAEKDLSGISAKVNTVGLVNLIDQYSIGSLPLKKS